MLTTTLLSEKLLKQYGMDDIQIGAACTDMPLDEACDIADRVEKTEIAKGRRKNNYDEK